MEENNHRTRSLITLLSSFLVAWVFYLIGLYLTYTGQTNGSPYLFLAAVTTLGFTALHTKRRVLRAGEASVETRSVYLHANTVLIIAIAAAAYGVLVIFFNLLMTDFTSTLERVATSYIPILLFTTVVVSLLLAGFVFSRSLLGLPIPSAQEASSEEPPSARNAALAYALPVSLAAIGAITMGIIYDATTSPLSAWVWVIGLALVATGALLGCYFSSKLARRSGEFIFNFVWMTCVSAIAIVMAMGFGASAISSLSTHATLGLESYNDSGAGSLQGAGEDSFPVYVQGTDLDPSIEVVVTVEGDTVFEVRPDGEGWLHEEFALTPQTTENTLRLEATAFSRTGEVLTAAYHLPVDEDGKVSEIDEFNTYVESESLQAPSTTWFVEELAPALLMLLLALELIFVSDNWRSQATSSAKLSRVSP